MKRILYHIKPLIAFIALLISCFSTNLKAQLYIGDGVTIQGGSIIATNINLVIDTKEINGEGSIVMLNEQTQKMIVKQNFSADKVKFIADEKLLSIEKSAHVSNNTIAKIKVRTLADEALIAKNFEQIITQQPIQEDTKELPVVFHKKPFKSVVLGVASIIKIHTYIHDNQGTTASSIYGNTAPVAVLFSTEFVELPQINLIEKESSDFYYTHTYFDDYLADILQPPKIG